MKKNSLVIKGNRYGIIIVMDEDASFDEIKSRLAEKLKEASKFFGNATMAVSFEGKELSNDEQTQLVDVISESSNLNIACVIDNDEHITEVFKKSVEKIRDMVDNGRDTVDESEIQEIEKSDDGNTGKFFRGTLRSGQILESDTSIVIIGDVNPGANVSAGGNVIILGSLKGNVSAGTKGDDNAFVVALDMAPVQIRIGDIIASCPEKPKRSKPETKIAYINNGNIFVDPLDKDLRKVLKF